MNSDSVSRIKELLSIEEFVGDYVKLERAGSHMKGCCPFHNEKSPSFFVSDERRSYYCFGCGAKGDIFSFVQEFEGIDFKAALQFLADRAGVQLETYKKDPKRDEYRRVMEGAARFYEACLQKDSSAKTYLQSRGLSEKTIQEWRIGCVPDEWRSVSDFLKTKKVSESLMDKVGLIKKGEKGSVYDRFRNRIMFPLFDQNGSVVAFSGRTRSDDPNEAKYLNSPETPLFNKSEILYGFNFAKKSIRKFDFSIIVEGQVDVIMAHQAGYTNTVATSGTALTEHHVEQLRRLSKRLVIALDGDGAGLRASKRAWTIALQKGMDVKVVLLPEGNDPASLIKENVAQWKECIKKAQHIIDFLITVRAQQPKEDNRTTIRLVREEILPYIQNLDSSMEQAHFIQKVSDTFAIPVDAIWDDVKSVPVKNDSQEKNNPKSEEVDSTGTSPKKNTPIEQLHVILFWTQVHGEQYAAVSDFIHQQLQKLAGDEQCQKWQGYYGPRKDQFLLEADVLYKNMSVEELQTVAEDLLHAYTKTLYERKRDYLRQELQKAEKGSNTALEAELLTKIQAISKKLLEL